VLEIHSEKRMGEANKDRTLSAPGIHGECVLMCDLSREEVDFCVVGAGAGGGVLGAKLAEAEAFQIFVSPLQ
jgi:hypothetical protein